MSEHRYEIRISESCVDPNPLMVERQDPDNLTRFQTRERCALKKPHMSLTWVYQIVIIMRMLLAVGTNTNGKPLNKFRHLYSDFWDNLQYNQTNILDLHY